MCSFVFANVASNLDQIANVTNEIQTKRMRAEEWMGNREIEIDKLEGDKRSKALG